MGRAQQRGRVNPMQPKEPPPFYPPRTGLEASAGVRTGGLFDPQGKGGFPYSPPPPDRQVASAGPPAGHPDGTPARGSRASGGRFAHDSGPVSHRALTCS